MIQIELFVTDHPLQYVVAQEVVEGETVQQLVDRLLNHTSSEYDYVIIRKIKRANNI